MFVLPGHGAAISSPPPPKYEIDISVWTPKGDEDGIGPGRGVDLPSKK